MPITRRTQRFERGPLRVATASVSRRTSELGMGLYAARQRHRNRRRLARMHRRRRRQVGPKGYRRILREIGMQYS